MLYEHRGRILDRKTALKKLWGENDFFTRRSMDVFISHLRKYLCNDPSIEIRMFMAKDLCLVAEQLHSPNHFFSTALPVNSCVSGCSLVLYRLFYQLGIENIPGVITVNK